LIEESGDLDFSRFGQSLFASLDTTKLENLDFKTNI